MMTPILFRRPLQRDYSRLLALAALMLSTGCGHDPGERALSGAGIGAGAGAGAALLGAPLVPALIIGGAAGAATGALTSDKQIDLDR